ncbi:MAG: alpha/beta hydrolase [Clostridium sp.]|jgi:pimeloyl-ACP methyl ester carboxylesterase|uniref:alpha/beta fold hydrolase n=1 Tax=Clostridium sp. TaxID=1506 RepID=UPI0025C1D0F5|nr:alpha/beta hydrolase [Clostridium sp.]MCH3965398.1 alpha/beta hydrolase [Clostridium sp.]MCI1717370.1 alpha/beta hydrolase [Clostridium sp.]MCI1801710.1 alpha/beta hydrolase [Clostridium sp.]MCI1815539.1 alpha/beta hydrolase [Clostridium sp.]MCI1872442.1 alpha/beta hydrolase [Clostridium sp.]
MKCKIDDISINYHIKGNGKPVVMIHGYAADSRLMMGCMEPAFLNKKDYKRIYMDLPGMGESSTSERITNADDMLDVIVDFIRKIIPDENFLLAGESYGGYLSRGIIYKMFEKVDGLLLICPVIIPDFKKRDLPEHVILVKDRKLLSQLNEYEIENFNSISVLQSEKIYRRYKDEVLSGLEAGKHEFLRYFQKNGYKFSFDVDKIDKKFTKPTLILLGHQDSRVGYKDAWTILNNYPRATFAVIDNAGHNLQIEQEDMFNYMVDEWIRRIQKEGGKL